jgi:hypothetical protein
MNLPDGALVADAWLRLVTNLPASCIGPTLPAARTAPVPDWVTSGFVQHTVVGGAPGIHVPTRRTVVQVDTWAVRLDSRGVPWGVASGLAETIWLGTFLDAPQQRALSVPPGYAVPLLRTVNPLGEPVKVPDDGAGFAHFRMDLEFNWTLSTMEVSS